MWIGEGAFYNTYYLYTVELYGVTYIDDYAFAYSGFSSIRIPYGVEYIGQYAFAYNDYLEYVIIERYSWDGIVWLGWGVFDGCYSLHSIKLQDWYCVWVYMNFSQGWWPYRWYLTVV